MRTRMMSAGGSVLLVALGIMGCKTPGDPPTHAEISTEISASATVEAIDRATREVTLQREDGSQLVVVAGPEVRNFDRLAVGDTIVTRYVESLSVRRLDPDEASIEPIAESAAARTAPGQAPGAAVAAGLAMDVTILSVDHQQHIVTFTGPSGQLRAVRAQRDEGKAFVEGLEAGDRVEIILGESVAISVE